MTTTPLPPFSEQQLKDALSGAFPFDTEQDGSWSLLESERRISEAVIAARDAQWQAYATQARADLEAENKRLREALRIAHAHIDMNALRVSHCKDAATITAALESTP